MTVKQLKEQLIGIPDDALIVCPGSDHSYRTAFVESTTAMQYGKNYLTEDFGDEYNDEGGNRIPVLLVV